METPRKQVLSASLHGLKERSSVLRRGKKRKKRKRREKEGGSNKVRKVKWYFIVKQQRRGRLHQPWGKEKVGTRQGYSIMKAGKKNASRKKESKEKPTDYQAQKGRGPSFQFGATKGAWREKKRDSEEITGSGFCRPREKAEKGEQP